MDKKLKSSVIINEREAEPLSDYVIDFLTSQRRESPFLDFKYIINLRRNSDFPEIAKDIFAFANYGGGWILIGWEESKKNQFVPVGLPESYEVDQAPLQEKFNSYCNEPIVIEYREFNRNFKSLFLTSKDEIRNKVNSISNRFAIIFVPPSHKILVPIKEGKYRKGDKTRVVFKKGDIFYRRGTQSIKASQQEINIIKKRLEKENYRISILSGEPDEVNETIYGNLFEVIKLPEFVYLGDKKSEYDDVSIKALLKQQKIFPEFYYKFKVWNKKIITFENLSDNSNPYRKLIYENTISKEKVSNWLKDINKRRIIIELLNRELKHYAINKGLIIFKKKSGDQLFYSTSSGVNKRQERWRSRYALSTRTVAAKMYAEQLGRFIYWHAAFNPNFIYINNKFYLRILPTFVITEDGRKPVSSFRFGTIITRLSYNKYNNAYLNTILFWIHQLGEGDNIRIKDYLIISNKPVELKTNVGILYDIPSSKFRIDSYEENIFEGDEDEF